MSSLTIVLRRFYSDSCHLPPSRLTDRWMSATSGALGLCSATPVNRARKAGSVQTCTELPHGHTPLSSAPHSDSKSPQGHPVKTSSFSLPVSMCCGDFEICCFFFFPSALCSVFIQHRCGLFLPSHSTMSFVHPFL